MGLNLSIMSISMDSTASMLLGSLPLEQIDNRELIKPPRINIPKQFVWPNRDLIQADEELREPLVDLRGFYGGDMTATRHAAKLVRAACVTHGFFQVINHGVDPGLVSLAHDHIDGFFSLPPGIKARARKKPGSMWGYSNAHSDRFSSRLPWKETLSFGYHEDKDPVVLDFFKSNLGEEFEQTGWVYQRYCESMQKVSAAIMELLGISLGVEDRLYYKNFFKDSNSIMRCNFYPPCEEPSLALGTGPHCDPTALTILHQDQVGGLEVFVNNRWNTVRPRPDALVINIGDTFSALSNGKYKSCLHRAVVNRHERRVSLAFFVCPRDDKLIKPPQDLVRRQGLRLYPDFTWSDLLKFTQTNYRADDATLQNFTKWFLSSNPPATPNTTLA